MHKPKLFHALVVMGAALTGGTAVSTGCGGDSGTGTTTTCDPKTDPNCDYAHISAPSCDADPSCYAHISVDATPSDAYAHIGFVGDANGDTYANISIDTGAGDAPSDVADAGEAG